MALQAGQRPFQIVVYGASGFTGRLVCEHIARDYRVRLDESKCGMCALDMCGWDRLTLQCVLP